MGRSLNARELGGWAFGAQHRRLLCPLDGESDSGHTIRAAAALANQLSAKLTLLHVIDAQRARSPGCCISKRLGALLADTALPTGSGSALIVQGKQGSASAITQVATEISADLIVLGAPFQHNGIVIAVNHLDMLAEVVQAAASLSLLDVPSIVITHGFGSVHEVVSRRSSMM